MQTEYQPPPRQPPPVDDKPPELGSFGSIISTAMDTSRRDSLFATSSGHNQLPMIDSLPSGGNVPKGANPGMAPSALRSVMSYTVSKGKIYQQAGFAGSLVVRYSCTCGVLCPSERGVSCLCKIQLTLGLLCKSPGLFLRFSSAAQRMVPYASCYDWGSMVGLQTALRLTLGWDCISLRLSWLSGVGQPALAQPLDLVILSPAGMHAGPSGPGRPKAMRSVGSGGVAGPFGLPKDVPLAPGAPKVSVPDPRILDWVLGNRGSLTERGTAS